MEIPYEELDNHFKAPKSLSFTFSKFPRKLKKRLKKVPYCNGNLNMALWYNLEENYKRFIIKKICEVK